MSKQVPTFVEQRQLTLLLIARKIEDLKNVITSQQTIAWQEQLEDVEILLTQATTAITHRQLVDILLDTSLEW